VSGARDSNADIIAILITTTGSDSGGNRRKKGISMKTITDQLDDFMESSFNNLWLNDDILSIYVRKGNHLFRGEILATLDVANIGTIPDEYKGKGHFKRFMKKAESIGLPIWVECIHNPDLVQMLVKHGYIIMDRDGIHAVKFTS
jgi:hypothetical protein